MTAHGRSIKLFLAEGTPGGLRTAEIINWTGHVVIAPRTALGSLIDMPESRTTGVYLLLGDEPDAPGGIKVYIGEADDVGKRLLEHSRDERPDGKGGKDFWNKAVAITSKDSNLTKTHAMFLEARLIELATSAERSKVLNGNKGYRASLPISDRSDMTYFVEQIQVVLPVLGISLLRSTRAATVAPGAETDAKESPFFRLTTKGEVSATAQEIDGEFIVREGSLGRPEWTTDSPSYQPLRQQLEDDGTLVLTDDRAHVRYTRDHAFSSPSAASAVTLGRNSNGRSEWKVGDSRQTYAEWQQSLVAAVDVDKDS